MTAPLSSIPALVPVRVSPSHSRPRTPPDNTTSAPDEKREALADRFATLFSPPTPPASRTRSPPAPIFPPPSATFSEPPPSARFGGRPGAHKRLPSLADDFGAFVSVSATDDPLFTSPPVSAPAMASASSSRPNARPIAPPQLSSSSLAFFESFGEDARAAEAGRRGKVLDELLAHEDDPLYWVVSEENKDTDHDALNASLAEDVRRSAEAPSSSSTPQPQPTQAVSEPSLFDVFMESPETPSLVPSFEEESSNRPPQQANPRSRRQAPTPLPAQLGRAPLSSSPPPMLSSQSASADTNPDPPSPKLTRGSFSSRWLPALLARPSTSSLPLTASAMHPSDIRANPGASGASPPPLTSSPSSTALASAANTLSRSLFGSGKTPPTSSSLPAMFIPPTAPGAPEPAPANPFAKHIYIPPSGAPGFAGDRAWAKNRSQFDDEEAGKAVVGEAKKPPKLVGRKEMTGEVLESSLAGSLRAHLPALPRLARTWTLLYSLDQHGISLSTLYARCAAHPGPAVLAMRDAGGTTFGAVIGGGIIRSQGYYGGGESFLWREKEKDRGADKIEVWKWTGRNDYVALCEGESISFGGGEGQYGLFLDESLFDGSSAQCPTFANPPLCSPAPPRAGAVPFECVGLEIWGVGP